MRILYRHRKLTFRKRDRGGGNPVKGRARLWDIWEAGLTRLLGFQLRLDRRGPLEVHPMRGIDGLDPRGVEAAAKHCGRPCAWRRLLLLGCLRKQHRTARP